MFKVQNMYFPPLWVWKRMVRPVDQHIELEPALEKILRAIEPQKKTHTIPLLEALGQISSEDIFSSVQVPAFNRSAMDGYAVVSANTTDASKESPIVLPVGEERLAGDYNEKYISPTVAVRVMTGACVPDGFDAVVKQEDTNCGEDKVEIYNEAKPFQNYSRAGEDIQINDRLISKMTKLTPVHLGILASAGIFEVNVFRPLKVGVVFTGDELETDKVSLKRGKIYNSNKYTLLGNLKILGCESIHIQLGDDAASVCEIIKKWIPLVDIMITTGGVSVGKKDIMHEVITRLGARKLFWRVNIQPGTPVLASTYKNKLILSLSGNPFAAFVNFELLVKPALNAMRHYPGLYIKKRAILWDAYEKKSKKRRFLRAFYQDGTVFLPASHHESSIISNMKECNCLIDIPAGTERLKKGAKIQVVLMSGEGGR